jgi:hypothetical protein
MAKDNFTNNKLELFQKLEDIEAGIIYFGGVIEDFINEDINTLVDEGKVFTYLDYTIYGASEVKDLVFDPIDYKGSKLKVFTPSFSATAGPVIIDVYFGTDAVRDPAKELFIYNRNGKSSNTAKSKAYINPIINSLGFRPGGRLVPSGGQNPATGVPGEAAEFVPVILDETQKVLFRIKNLNGADTYIETNVVFIEY